MTEEGAKVQWYNGSKVQRDNGSMVRKRRGKFDDWAIILLNTPDCKEELTSFIGFAFYPYGTSVLFDKLLA